MGEGPPKLPLDEIRKRARDEGRRAGRAAGRDESYAESKGALESRGWIIERFDEHKVRLEVFYTSLRNETEERKRVASERLKDAEEEASEAEEKIAVLEPAYVADKQNPPEKRDLELEADFERTKHTLKRARAERDAQEVEVGRLEERLEAIVEEAAKEALRVDESRDAVLREHNMAYDRAEHSTVTALFARIWVRFGRSPDPPAEPTEGEPRDG